MSLQTRRTVGLLMLSFVLLVWMVPLFAQGSAQTGTEVGSGTAGNDPGAVISAQFVISYFFSWLIQLAKRSNWTWLRWFRDGADVANRVLAAILAAAQALGIAVHFDTAAGTLLVTGLSLSLIWPAIVEVARAYIAQRLLYIFAFKRPEGATVPELKEAVL